VVEGTATIPPVQDLEIPASGGKENADSEAQPSVAAEAGSRNEETTAGLAPPSGDQLIAILMDRDEIKSISDLFNNTVAIDISLRILCPR
jgi:hypothetical protein